MLTKQVHNKTRELTKKAKRCYEIQRLHIYDKGGRNSVSGINATLFGGTSPLGAAIGSRLTMMGSTCVYPHRATGDFSNPIFRELRVAADLGYKTSIKLTDFTDQDEIDVTLKHSNVVICTVGSRKFFNNHKDFEDANINVPRTIAKAVRDKGDKVKRFIYVSAAGADPNSSSRRLRTKWIGEQEVKEICPDVTILRPTTMFNEFEPNNSFQGKWGYMMKMFNRTLFRIEGSNGLIQPVDADDVALAAVNCLKMDETIGQTYELGGPHVYTHDEVYEQLFNATGIRPYIIPIKLEVALEWMHSYKLSSIYRYAGKYWMYPEILMGEHVDVTVQPDAKTFEDLYIKPISFGHKTKDYVADIYSYYNTQDEKPLDNVRQKVD